MLAAAASSELAPRRRRRCRAAKDGRTGGRGSERAAARRLCGRPSLRTRARARARRERGKGEARARQGQGEGEVARRHARPECGSEQQTRAAGSARSVRQGEATQRPARAHARAPRPRGGPRSGYRALCDCDRAPRPARARCAGLAALGCVGLAAPGRRAGCPPAVQQPADGLLAARHGLVAARHDLLAVATPRGPACWSVAAAVLTAHPILRSLSLTLRASCTLCSERAS